MKENGFALKKGKKQPIPAKTNTDAYYADYLAHRLEQVAGDIGLHVNADKAEYMCFNQKGDISTVNGGFLKLVDKFTYLGSSVSSTESDINIRLAKAWTGIDRLSIIWKSKLSVEIKSDFFQVVVVSILLNGR